jgi:glycosyltransferase involved in cell wall biosynthesis
MRVSIVIPTIGRFDSLARLLETFVSQTHVVDEIVIVDQSQDGWKEREEWQKKLPIVYIHTSVRSLPKARNIGVAKSTGDIVGFLDDDIVLSELYIERLHVFFETHPDALGVQGVIENFIDGHVQKVGGTFWYGMYARLSHFFCLNTAGKENKIFLSGRNCYAVNPPGIVSSQWLSGIGNYRRSVFETHSFDELMSGYALGEDKMFSYGIYRQYSQSLFTDPSIKCSHYHAFGGRPEHRVWSRMKVYYTFYFWYTYFGHMPAAYVAFWWANMWDIALSLVAVLLGRQSCRALFWQVVYYTQVLIRGKRIIDMYICR